MSGEDYVSNDAYEVLKPSHSPSSVTYLYAPNSSLLFLIMPGILEMTFLKYKVYWKFKYPCSG